jgi:hypothetical protein
LEVEQRVQEPLRELKGDTQTSQKVAEEQLWQLLILHVRQVDPSGDGYIPWMQVEQLSTDPQVSQSKIMQLKQVLSVLFRV